MQEASFQDTNDSGSELIHEFSLSRYRESHLIFAYFIVFLKTLTHIILKISKRSIEIKGKSNEKLDGERGKGETGDWEGKVEDNRECDALLLKPFFFSLVLRVSWLNVNVNVL